VYRHHTDRGASVASRRIAPATVSPRHILFSRQYSLLSQDHKFIHGCMYVLTLPHDNTTHKNLNRPDPLERHLALPRRLVQSQLMSQFILRYSVRVIDLIAEDQEGCLAQIFHREEGVEFGFGFGEALVVFGVDEEDNAGDLGEVVAPEAAGWKNRCQR
jgi:hypothetical protein